MTWKACLRGNNCKIAVGDRPGGLCFLLAAVVTP
jgi:hypothetical protein